MMTLMKLNKSISGVPLHDCLIYEHNEVSVVLDRLLIFDDDIFKVFLEMGWFLVDMFRNLCGKLEFGWLVAFHYSIENLKELFRIIHSYLDE